MSDDKYQPPQRFNLYYDGESAPPHPHPPPPRSSHPNIETFELPPELTGSVGKYLEEHPLSALSTNQKVAVAVTLNKCAKFAELPQMLQRMGLEKVTVQANAELVVTCDGYAKEMIPQVVSSLAESARNGDISAILTDPL